MLNIVFIKTSSLGDVVHFMPAVTEAKQHHPEASISWVIEEAFVPLASLHPALDAVVPIATRRWRRELLAGRTWREAAGFVRRARRLGPDLTVIDAQGLIRTGIVSSLFRGLHHGYNKVSIREKTAAWAYDVRHAVAQQLHAIERNRLLVGMALGYRPEGAANYGLDAVELRAGNDSGRYALLFHATAEPAKQWPVRQWIELANGLARRGLRPVLPWNTDEEHQRSAAIVDACAGAKLPERVPLNVLARDIAGASLVVGVDTGLVHLAAALSVPLIAIFTASDPALTGPIGQGRIAVLGHRGATVAAPDVLGALDAVR